MTSPSVVTKDARRFPFSALLLMLVMIGLLVGAIITVARAPEAFRNIVKTHNAQDWIQGRGTLQAEDTFEDLFYWKDSAVGLWGSVRYLLFHTGNPGVVIGSDQWLFTSEEFESYKNSEQELAHKLDIITRVEGYLRRHQVQLVILLVPAKARLHGDHLGRTPLPAHKHALYQDFRHQLLARGLYAPDMLNLFEGAASQNQLFMRTDTHWTPRGAEFAAQGLHTALQRDCPSLSLTKKPFATVTAATESYRGDLTKFVPTGWLPESMGIRAEKLERRETHAQQEAEASEALFADEILPVVLVGTSYSAHAQWNFEGALKTALQSDVMNVADEGGGPMKPMAAYLKAASLESSPPQLVIWEIPERFLEKEYKEVTFNLPDIAVDLPAPLCHSTEPGEAR